MRYNIFPGCSFTWGQGLWYYHDTDKYIPNVNEYIHSNMEIPIESLKFKNDNRWPQLVCNEIGNTPLVKQQNGGTDYESIEFIYQCIDEYGIDNIDYLVFQTTQLYRSPFPFTYKGELYHLRGTPTFSNLNKVDKVKKITKTQIHYGEEDCGIDIFYEFLFENKLDIEEFKLIHRDTMIGLIKDVLIMCENNNIKTYITSWTDEYLESIKNDKFLKDRFITYEYNGNHYDCMEYAMLSNTELVIQKDDSVLHDSGGDGHPSLGFHKIISEQVLNKINKPFI